MNWPFVPDTGPRISSGSPVASGIVFANGQSLPNPVGPPSRQGGTMLAQVRDRDHSAEHSWLARYPRDVPHHLEYPPEPVSWLLEETARRVPDRVACRHGRE